jgi:hypothetical protein
MVIDAADNKAGVCGAGRWNCIRQQLALQLGVTRSAV